MSNNIQLRPAQRSDIPTLARVINAANVNSAIHRRMSPGQDQYPASHYHWRLNHVRQSFINPELTAIIAEDSVEGTLLGVSWWAYEGQDPDLRKEWTRKTTWSEWLEGQFLWVENIWFRWLMDRSTNYDFVNTSMAAFVGGDAERPPCLHLHLLMVDPKTHAKGVGKTLIDWGKKQALKANLPLYVESNLEATGFYEKCGFNRLAKSLLVEPLGQDSILIPTFAWESEQRQGRWLERDTTVDGDLWKWKNRSSLN